MWKNNPFKKSNSIPSKPITSEHKHSWTLVAKTYARPRTDVSGITDKEMAERAIFGVTSLAWECADCGETRQEYMLGSDQNTLDEVLDKVLEFGQQMVERDGNRYLVTKWVVQPVQPGVLPIR